MINSKRLKKSLKKYFIPSFKKGQGLSLNVIIVAALALIVLVVLVAVFTGRIGIFERGIGQEAQTELVKMRVGYGQCGPSAGDEATFNSAYSQAESTDEKEDAKTNLKNIVDSCKAQSNDKSLCESAGCKWR